MMTKTPWLAGAALAATLAAAAYAQATPDSPPRTRAELQAKVAEHFRKADANGDGFITRAEFDAARTAMRAEFAERREEMFAMLDKDRNGSLSKDEFMAPPQPGGPDGPEGMDRSHDGHGDGMMRHGRMGGDWFARTDTDKDGRISLTEASAGALAMFDRVDTDHDGTVSPQEHDAARDAMRARWRDGGAG
ncbi:EF-hand domain-containing protein [Rhizorhabdus argentea]|uniref:EF-hand domain-containing protein n=1 Tax=Rhizorhabdus argentea TaxID=1387174 RepID=UPI0030EE9541